MSAFTYPWDETYPLDSQTANLLGSDLRRVLAQIRERLGDLTGVSFANDTTTTPAFSYLRLNGAASPYIIPGATQFSIRNALNTQDNWIIDNSGNVTIRGTFVPVTTGVSHLGSATFRFGNLNLDGEIFFYGAAAKIVGGTASLSLRNNADTLNNLIITDAGVVTIRAGLTVTAGDITAQGGNLNVSGSIASTAAGNISTASGNIYTNLGQAAASYNIGASAAGVYTANWNKGNNQQITLTGNTVISFSNPIQGATYTLILFQDATGSRTVTWPVSVIWPNNTPPVLTITANKSDRIVFTYDGSFYFGYLAGAAYPAH